MAMGFHGLGPNRTRIRRQKILLIGVGSVAFALLVITGLLVYSSNTVQAREAGSSEPNDAFGTVVLVAPISRVPKGTKLTREYVKEIQWPRDQVPEGALRGFAEAEGMFAASVLPPNQPILRTSVAVTLPAFGISELLPPGHRAVTIEVDEITGIEGWATAGAHVDVLVTYLDQEEGVHRTRVAVEDAIVLSYGRNANRAKSGNDDDLEANKIAQTVTLAVPLEDSLKIQTATAIGKINLALRNSNDITSKGDKAFSANDWDNTKPAPKVQGKEVPKGFIKFYDPEGKEKEFVLDQNEQWYKSQQDDD